MGSTTHNVPNLPLGGYTTIHCTNASQKGEIWNYVKVHKELVTG